MKHLILVLLALLLTGCTSEATDLSDPFTQSPMSTAGPASVPVIQPSEIHYSRALSAYDTGIYDCRGIYPMGADMLLLSGNDETMLTVLSDSAVIRTQKALPCQADPANGTMQVNEHGIAYYDGLHNAVVYLNTDLLEIQRIALPSNIGNHILLSPDWTTAYYCSQNGIHALDLHTSIPRLIRRHTVTDQKLTGLYLDGALLACQVTYEDGHSECLYLSTQTGEACYPEQSLQRLYTGNGTYLASFRDGSVDLWLTGKPEGKPWMIHVSQTAEVVPLYRSDALAVLETADNQTELSYLDLPTGRRVGALTLDSHTEVSFLSGDDGTVWFLAKSSDNGKQLLYRWLPVWSKVWSPRSYYRTYYTADTPDTDGLLRQAYHASILGNTYGINILTGRNAMQFPPAGYTVETEYRIAAYERDLKVLEKALSNFPPEFFRDAASGTKNQHLTVNLVRDLRAEGSQASLPGKQYWLNESAYITLVMGPELEQSFYHQLCHIIDTRVMGTTSVYDDWASLNPNGVIYTNSHQLSPPEADEAWFSGDTRVFVDRYAMSFPREDRARILEYAMMPGNEAVFASETMQRKLATLCLGIRQAFALDDSATYLWEQYLITESK